MKPRLSSIFKRKSKVEISLFAKPWRKDNFSSFSKNIPDILAGKNFKDLVLRIKEAKESRREIVLMFGAHLIKCGLSSLVVELIKKGFITSLATNGAGIIHDFEIAFCGKTSEDVAESLKKGMFGMSKETGEFINQAAEVSFKNKIGYGEAVGRLIEERKLSYRKYSLAWNSFKRKIPFCVFVAIGTDIVHQHPQARGEAIGFASLKDFHKFREVVSGLEGGVVLNFGSAVILPEVFLKAVNLSRNLGYRVENFTAANFDMYPMYRPRENIINRPTQGKGFYFIGHHEIMFPLLYRMLLK